MKFTKITIWSIGLTALIALAGAAGAENIAERGFYVKGPDGDLGSFRHTALRCKGEVQLVLDAADETLHFTSASYGTSPGGGEGGQFDRTPVLTIEEVSLDEGECLNAHFSALVGSAQTYGVAPLTLFQVTLTPLDGSSGPVAIVGHYDTPYGIPSPAVALEAERDVDMIGANFFQAVGGGEHEVPPNTYRVDVWWAGAPPGAAGGAIGAAFVLKLYLRD